MSWIAFVLVAQFLSALVVIVDKHIVTARVVSKPIVYTFYVSLLSIIAIVALPFGVTIPSLETVIFSLAAALCYILSIYFLYKTLRQSDPSDAIPVIGGISALTTFIASNLALEVNLPAHFLAGFFILIIGMIIISHFRFNRHILYELALSGFFFGISIVLIKIVFLNDTFVNGFFWSRMANVVIALTLLLLPGIWRLVKNDHRMPSHTKKGVGRQISSKIIFILSNKVLAGAAFFLILLAIKFGDVSLVSALGATQYIFLFIFALLWHKSFPDYFSPLRHKHELIHKVSSIALIVIGFMVLFI